VVVGADQCRPAGEEHCLHILVQWLAHATTTQTKNTLLHKNALIMTTYENFVLFAQFG
jgi:hypothetical protein